MILVQWKTRDFSENKSAIYYYIYVTFQNVAYSVILFTEIFNNRHHEGKFKALLRTYISLWKNPVL